LRPFAICGTIEVLAIQCQYADCPWQLLANSADSKLPPNVHSIAGSLDSSSAFLHFMLRKF